MSAEEENALEDEDENQEDESGEEDGAELLLVATRKEGLKQICATR